MRLQFLVAIICMLLRQSLTENVARYDNYRMYIVHFENSEQVKVFQDLEAHSDSCMFMGHARQVGQTLSILVAAHKIADFADLLQRYTVEHDILVSISSICAETIIELKVTNLSTHTHRVTTIKNQLMHNLNRSNQRTLIRPNSIGTTIFIWTR